MNDLSFILDVSNDSEVNVSDVIIIAYFAMKPISANKTAKF